MARRLLGASAVAVLALAVAAPALADGDPASDYLLTRPLFVPQDDGVPAANVDQLTSVLADARAHGYTIRVALIGTRYDMGSVYQLWKHPQLYARFLGQELHFLYKGRLLVAMPNGYGTSLGGRATPAQQAIVDKLPAPGTDGAALANGAARAVQKLAAQAGVVIALPALSASRGSSATRDRITIAIGVAVLLAAGFAAFWGRRFVRARKVVR